MPARRRCAHPGEPWREILATPLYRDALLRTFRLSLTVTLACLVLGYPVAYALARARGWRGQILLALVVAPFWISVLARSFTWMVLLQRQGAVNRLLLGLGVVGEPMPLVYNEIGVHIAMIHVLLPYMILSLFGAMRGIDPGLLRAAAGLGASEWQTFRRVWWPLSRSGVAAGSLLLFVVALGFFITPALLGGGKVHDPRDADRGPREPGTGLAARIRAGSDAAGRDRRRAGAGAAGAPAGRARRGREALTWRFAWRSGARPG